MVLAPTLRQEIVNFLLELDAFHTEDGRKAILLRAGLDKLIPNVKLQGTTGEIVPLLVEYLAQYGLVREQQQPALICLLQAVKTQVGTDKQILLQEFCDRLTQQRRQISATCPYRGLSAFREEDEEFFFGRDTYTKKLVEAVQRQIFVAVLGASGSGKSSLVYAGVIPTLRNQTKWLIVSLRPGEHPLHSLSNALISVLYHDPLDQISKRKQFTEQLRNSEITLHDVIEKILENHDKADRILLVIDQFEELYALCDDADERGAFIRAIIQGPNHQAKSANGLKSVLESDTFASKEAIHIILILRSDFLGYTHSHPELSHLIAEQSIIIPTMDNDELRAAIAEPAQRAGQPLSEEVVDLLIEQSAGREGALPLLEFALMRIWDGIANGVEPAETLKQIGGLGGALANKAQELFDSLDETEQQIARRAFLAMIRLGEGTKDTRRRVNIVDIVAHNENLEQVRRVLNHFAHPSARLITLADDTAEITHEALFDHWETLKSWLDTCRDDLRFHRQLEETVKEWEAHKRPNGSLWRPPKLDLLRQYHQRNKGNMAKSQMEFFQESEIQEEEALQKNKSRKREIIGLILILISITILAIDKTYEARNAQQLAERTLQMAQDNYDQTTTLIEKSLQEVQNSYLQARTLLAKNYWMQAIEAKEEGDWLKASHYFARSAKEETNESQIKNCILNIQDLTRYSFLIGIGKSPQAEKPRLGNEDLDTVYDSKIALVVHTKNGALAGPPLTHDADINGAILTKEKTRVLTWSDDGTARLWNTADGSLVFPPLQHNGAVKGATFNHDETWILTWSADGTARLWNVADGSLVFPPLQHNGVVEEATFHRDETWIFTRSADDTARLWNVKDGNLVIPPLQHDQIKGARVNPEETLILTWGADRTAKLWRASDGSLAAPLLQLDSVGFGAQFSPDDNLILLLTRDGSTARLWHAKEGTPVSSPIHHDAMITGAIFSENQQLVAIWSDLSHTLRVWDTKDGTPASLPLRYNDAWLSEVEFLDGNQGIYGLDSDGVIHVWHINDESLVFPPIQHEGRVNGAKFSNNEKLILTWGIDSSARLWNAENGTPAVPPMLHNGPVTKAAFSRDDNLILTQSTDGVARLWHVEDGSPAAPPMPHDGIAATTFSNNGHLILTGSTDGTVRLWHTKNGKLAISSIEHASVNGAMFSKDDRLLLTRGGNTVRVWQTKDGSPFAKPMRHDDIVNGAMFINDGQWVLSWSDDGTARVWHTQNGSLAFPLMRHYDKSIIHYTLEHQKTIKKLFTKVSGATFSPDESLVATWGDDYIKIWQTTDNMSNIHSMKHDGIVEKAMFNSEGTLVLSYDSTDKIYLWNAKDGTSAAKPMSYDTQPYNEELIGVGFSHDERLIISWGNDGRAILWHAQDGTLFKTLMHDKSVLGAMFNEDDSQVLTWSEDGTVRVWDIGADYDFPKESLQSLVAVMTGTFMDPFGNVRVLNQKGWEEVFHTYYRTPAEEHLKICQNKKYNLFLKQQQFAETILGTLQTENR